MKKITILLSLLIFILVGCSDFLDVNENPNYPNEVEDYLIMPAAHAGVASIMSADYGLIGGFWSQHWAQNNTSSQYKTFETYTLSSNSGRVDGSYRVMYYGALQENELMHVNAKTEENWNLYIMTSTLKAYAFQYLVDLYGNVPYEEAFLGEQGNFTPVIDKGEAVYASIYTLLNDALSKEMDLGVDVRYKNYDLLLAGDVSNWVDFANTLKLRILLRQFDANTAWATTELTSLLATGSFLTTDVSLTNFENVDSKSNPLFEADQRQLNTSNNIRANATFTSYLKANGDTRIDALFEIVNNEIRGMITGTYELPSTVWEAPDRISKPILTATMPVHLMTVAETELLLAEAYLRLGNAANAAIHYNDGVLASFSRMGLDGSAFVAAGGAYEFPTGGTFDEQLEAIIMQKWVDAADGQRGYESFIEQVRTGYPAIAAADIQSSIPEGDELDLPTTYIPGTLIYSKKGASGGKFPQRLPYADSELNYNSKAAEYKALPDMQVMLSSVWWNK